MMRRGAGPNKRGGKFTPKSGGSAGRSGPSSAASGRSNAKGGNASSKRGAVADQKSSLASKKKPLPQSQLDVYEDSSDGEGNAAFYSHIDEEARPDMDGMDAAARRRFKSTMINAEEGDDEDEDVFEDDEEIDEDEAFDEEDEKRYGEILGGIGQKGSKDAKGKATIKPKGGKKAQKHRVRREEILNFVQFLHDCFVDNNKQKKKKNRKSRSQRAMTLARRTRTTTTARQRVRLAALLPLHVSR
jgi:hypothetical protein